MKTFLFCILAPLTFSCVTRSQAGSATWSANPPTGDWNSASNWMPATVPNGPADVASFDFSNTVSVSLSAEAEVDGIVFNPGASAYTLTATTRSELTLSGLGITNNSGVTQNFATTSFEGDSSLGVITFTGTASAGEDTVFTNHDGIAYVVDIGTTVFRENSSAGQATIINRGGSAKGRYGGQTAIYDNATGGDSTIIVDGAEVSGAYGATLYISGNAGNANIIINGGVGKGGYLIFDERALGGTARIQVFGNGTVDQSQAAFYGGVTVGSIEGDGAIALGGFTLTVGSNNLSTTFSGVIKDGSSADNGGSLRKIGTGVLTLASSNRYTGGTNVEEGGVIVANTAGSGTGSGEVEVDGGSLGGNGRIAGTVTIGTGSGTGAFLAPAFGTMARATLSIQKSLTFNSDATYTYTYRAKNDTASTDLVVAKGVTINPGAALALDGTINGRLTPGLVFNVINNTSANPISGTFSNLPDGSTITLAGNTLQANYDGGDGNDLTLTVVSP